MQTFHASNCIKIHCQLYARTGTNSPSVAVTSLARRALHTTLLEVKEEEPGHVVVNSRGGEHVPLLHSPPKAVVQGAVHVQPEQQRRSVTRQLYPVSFLLFYIQL